MVSNIDQKIYKPLTFALRHRPRRGHRPVEEDGDGRWMRLWADDWTNRLFQYPWPNLMIFVRLDYIKFIICLLG